MTTTTLTAKDTVKIEIAAASDTPEAHALAAMLYAKYIRRALDGNMHIRVCPDALEIEGAGAHGFIDEAGVHALTRASPYDMLNRRHTSFANVAVSGACPQDVRHRHSHLNAEH